MNTASCKPALRLHMNWRCDRDAAYGPAQMAVIDHDSRAQARETIASWPGYAPTPLIELPHLAEKLGIKRLRIKHESKRFTLKSF